MASRCFGSTMPFAVPPRRGHGWGRSRSSSACRTPALACAWRASRSSWSSVADGLIAAVVEVRIERVSGLGLERDDGSAGRFVDAVLVEGGGKPQVIVRRPIMPMSRVFPSSTTVGFWPTLAHDLVLSLRSCVGNRFRSRRTSAGEDPGSDSREPQPGCD